MKRWFDFFDLNAIKQVRFMTRLGAGRAVSIYVPRGAPNVLGLKLEHKITPADVSGGRLLPLAIEITKRRGGKRSIITEIDYDTAVALHQSLGKGLRVIRRRRRLREIISFLIPQLHLSLRSVHTFTARPLTIK